MQLQLLRLESDRYNIDSEDGAGQGNSPSHKEEMLQTYMDEEDRDYSYILDMLTDLGIHGMHGDIKLHVQVDVFEKLEKKYGVFVGWSKSERKLLFDLANSVLEESLSPCMNQKPWLKPKRKPGLEEAWQMVARVRKESCPGKPEENILDPRWLDLGDNVDMMGRELEEILEDKLLEELVSDILD